MRIALGAAIACAVLAGCEGAGPTVCSENPGYYHVLESAPARPTAPAPTTVRHIPRDEPERQRGVAMEQAPH